LVYECTSECRSLAHALPRSQTGVIPSGPRLLATTDSTDYSYLVSDTDQLELWTQSFPGIGDATGVFYSRKVEMVLSSRIEETYTAALAANVACAQVFAPLEDFDLLPDSITISAAASELTNTADGEATVCYFNHKWTMAYNTFRSGGSCGFVLGNDMSVENSTFTTLTGRVHVRWTDYYNATVVSTGAEPRDSMSTWWALRLTWQRRCDPASNTSHAHFRYDVTLRIQSEANRTSAPTENDEDPYNADFKVTGITYTKDNDGIVIASIGYTLSTIFPYYPTLPTGGFNDILRHDGASYSGNNLLTLANYPASAFENTLSADGSSMCDAPGETCTMTGVLTYTWTPSDPPTTSCKISSSTPYQFEFMLQCNNDYNGTDLITQSCNTPMREALGLSAFGSFSLEGNLDFCKTASTDFPITWSTAFDVAEWVSDWLLLDHWLDS
jgi:hypothetical protein